MEKGRGKMNQPIQPATTREQRIEIVNKIIAEIGNRGCRFLHCMTTGLSGKFVHEQKLWYYDPVSNRRVYPYPRCEHRNFSGGGTLWALINDFRYYIMTGEPSNSKYGYGGLYCPHWGYPEEDMKAIRTLAIELGYLGSYEEERRRHRERHCSRVG